MRIDLYTTCWNDARMLPFFFRHYDRLIQRYIIFDDNSTDDSRKILCDQPKVDLRRFERSHAESFVLSELHLSNTCWKESRGRADWVMVLDLDEHLFHAKLNDYLNACRRAGVTIVPALGFQMMTERFPAPNENLTRAHPYGAPWTQMCKTSVFDPERIEEINFNPGRHRTDPVGIVVAPASDELLNLHYKYLGFDYITARHRQLLGGLGPADETRGWGHKYRWSDAQLREDWNKTAEGLIDVTSDPAKSAQEYPLPRWWESWRRAGTKLQE
jgi:glycosyltransferase involved in cell wall biosynthesis